MARICLLRCVFSPILDVLVCVGSGMSGFVKKMHNKTNDTKTCRQKRSLSFEPGLDKNDERLKRL